MTTSSSRESETQCETMVRYDYPDAIKDEWAVFWALPADETNVEQAPKTDGVPWIAISPDSLRSLSQ
jgi:hypothetical protein